MRNYTPAARTIEPRNWARLRINDPVTVIEPHGYAYEAVVDSKTPDSSVIWVRRPDINTRHLIECRDGVRIRPSVSPSGAEPVSRNALQPEISR